MSLRELVRASARVLGTEHARPARVRQWPHAWWLAVATVCFGAFMGQLDASIVTLTYRPLQTEFGASLAAVQWVSLAYLVALAAFLVPMGRLADAHGRKLLYLYGFVVFTAASAASGLAPDLGLLVVFRAAQGLGAAMLQANSVALVITSAPRARMRAALGVQAAAQAIGLALGPTVGGLLVGAAGWRWVFGLNVPVGLVAVVAGIYLLPRTRTGTSADPAPSRIVGRDRSGVLLLATSTTAGLLGLSAVSGAGVPLPAAVALLCLAAVGTVGFVVREHRAAAPMLDLALLRDRTIATGLVGALAGYLVLFGPLVLVPIALTSAGSSAMRAGLLLTALPAGFALAATTSERLLPRTWTDRRRCTLGAVLSLAGLAGMAAAPLSETRLLPCLALLGLGLGVFTPANNSAVMRSVPELHAGTGGGLVNMARSLGTALGVALVALALYLRPAGAHLTDGPRACVLVLIAAGFVMLASAIGRR